jgi:stage V sporulation protein K
MTETRPDHQEAAKKSQFLKTFEGLLDKYDSVIKSDNIKLTVARRRLLYAHIEKAAKAHKNKPLSDNDLQEVLGFLSGNIHVDPGNHYFSRIVEILELFSCHGNALVLNALADIYSSFGIDTPYKYKKNARASILYEKAAKSADLYAAGYAQSRLAQIAALSQNGEIAVRHARASAYDSASPYGQKLLGCWMYDGYLVDKDWLECFKLLNDAYETVKASSWEGFWIKAEIMFHFGFVLYYGHGCTQDEDKGLDLMRGAAKRGDVDAKNWLVANQFEDGVLPPENSEKEWNDSVPGSDIQINPKYKDHILPSGAPKDDKGSEGGNPMVYFAGKTKKKRMQKVMNTILSKKKLSELLAPLHGLIGVAPVKKEIESLIYLAHANALRMRKNIPAQAPLSLHAAFLGAPGTGKTTVARLYGKILHELGYLTKGHLVEVTRNDLIGEYVGQTTPKVRDVVDRAAGGVLFVDEAYSLIPDDGWGGDFGYEAVAELIQQMENRRDNFVVIFAGYTDQMKSFLKVNPGLKSRVPNVIEFPDYAADELAQVFKKFAEDSKFLVTPDALDRLKSNFKKMDKETIRRFGNARGVRNVFEDSLIQQARRIVKEKIKSRKALITIESADISIDTDPGKGIVRIVKS